MFLIFAYIAIFVAAVYLFFKFLVVSSSYLLLIDETFLNRIKESEDSLVQKFRNPAPSEEGLIAKDEMKRLLTN